MALPFVDRDAIHSTPYADRPITAVIVHDMESPGLLTTQQSLGGWQWAIDRDGTLYRDCDEAQAAWGVEAFGNKPALNRCPRPSWLVACPDQAVSDVNYCTVQIELVSGQTFRDAGMPYTPEQYATLQALLADLGARYGPLPVVGHGELQTDRSDPVAFDWTQIERVLPTPAPLNDWQRDMLSLMDPPLSLNAESVRQLVSDKSALETQSDQLREEVSTLKEQLLHTIAQGNNDIVSVRIRRRSGIEEGFSA